MTTFKRMTIVRIHVCATVVAVLTIANFFTFSLIAEMMGDHHFIRQVKIAILYCLPLLICAMPVLGLTGLKLAHQSKSPLVKAKLRRMKLVGMNGLLLIGLACFLYYRAVYVTIDTTFFIAQIIELVLGGINLLLIGLNIRDGLKLSGRMGAA